MQQGWSSATAHPKEPEHAPKRSKKLRNYKEISAACPPMSTALDQRVATNGNTANRARRPEALTVWALSSPGEASAKKQNGSRSSRFEMEHLKIRRPFPVACDDGQPHPSDPGRPAAAHRFPAPAQDSPPNPGKYHPPGKCCRWKSAGCRCR